MPSNALATNNVDAKWMVTGKTRDARFFHRLLPLDRETLVAIGGANMDSGKFAAPEVINVEGCEEG